MMTRFLTSASIAGAMAATSFEQFRLIIDARLPGGPIHAGGHGVIGGEMSNAYSSPGGEFDTILCRFQSLMCI